MIMKYKRRRIDSSFLAKNRPFPSCLSVPLIQNKSRYETFLFIGKWVCMQDKMNLWVKLILIWKVLHQACFETEVTMVTGTWKCVPRPEYAEYWIPLWPAAKLFVRPMFVFSMNAFHWVIVISKFDLFYFDIFDTCDLF